MKKNRLLILVIILIAGITAYFVIRKETGTIDEELRDFAFKDTAAITKIFLADRTGAQVTLERKGPGDWVLPDGSEARNDAVNNLLVVIRDVGIRSPVSRSAYNNVIRMIATKAIKVEIYTAEGLVKTYYVAGPSMDQMGTFMHLEGSSAPFVTHIPGFNGYLTPRYNTNIEVWKTHRIFNYKPNEIAALTAVDNDFPGYHVRIEKGADGNFTVADSSGKPAGNVSQDKIISYLQFFDFVNYENLEKSLSKTQLDSLTATRPLRFISITATNGQKRSITMWKRPQTPNTTNKTNASGEPYPYDIDRMTARMEGDSQFIVVQYYVFDKLFRKPSDFISKP